MTRPPRQLDPAPRSPARATPVFLALTTLALTLACAAPSPERLSIADILANADRRSVGSDARSQVGLMPRWELDRYFEIREPRIGGPAAQRFVTPFGRETLAGANVALVGAPIRIVRDLPNVEGADIAVLGVVYPFTATVGDRATADFPSVIRVYTPQIGYFSGATTEQMFFLRGRKGVSIYDLVATFPLQPAQRDLQIETVRMLIQLELADLTPAVRLTEAIRRAIAGARHDEPWVANAWAYQLAGLAQHRPLAFDRSRLAQLRQLERDLVRFRPTYRGAIQGVSAAVAILIERRFKRVWLREILESQPDRALHVAALYRDAIAISYRAAFEINDRRALQTVREEIRDPAVSSAVLELDLTLRALLESDG